MLPFLLSGSEILICEKKQTKTNKTSRAKLIVGMNKGTAISGFDVEQPKLILMTEANIILMDISDKTMASITNAKGQCDDMNLFFATQKNLSFSCFSKLQL